MAHLARALLYGAVLALAAAGTLVALVVRVPAGTSIRPRHRASDARSAPMLHYWLWALAVAAVFGGVTLLYWYGLP